MACRVGPRLLLVIILLGAHQLAQAEIFFGVKVGTLDYDLPFLDMGIGTSLQLGYEFSDLGVVAVAAELELTRSEIDFEFSSQDLGFKSTGLYAALRTAGPVYGIARAGLLRAELDDETESGSAFGIGLGLAAGIRWEIEYTQYTIDGSEDIDYLTLGVHF